MVFCPWEQLPDHLRKLSLTVKISENGESIIINNGRQNIGLTDVDPPTKAVMLCAAISGSFRVGFYFPGLMPKVQQKWKEISKRSKKKT